LAPLGDVRENPLTGIIQQMADRLAHEISTELAAKLWTSTYILMGLRYEQALIDRLLQGVRAMEESVTYQAILEKGMEKGLEKGREEGKELGVVEGEKSILMAQARKRLGKPTKSDKSYFESIADAKELAKLAIRLLDVRTWQDWLKMK
jgi:predicted transposase YdaD